MARRISATTCSWRGTGSSLLTFGICIELLLIVSSLVSRARRFGDYHPTGQPEQAVMPDPAELLIKEARERTRRRRLRWTSLFTLLIAACLIGIGIVHYTSSPTRTSNGRPDASAATTCPSARVKLLGVTGMPGGSGHGGLLVRASASSSAACVMSGYPIVGPQLTSHSTAMASDVRNAYLGGGMTTNAPLPRLSVTSRPRVVSFTVDMNGGGGIPSTCPQIKSIKLD